MNNRLTYCGLVDTRISASEKDLSVKPLKLVKSDSEFEKPYLELGISWPVDLSRICHQKEQFACRAPQRCSHRPTNLPVWHNSGPSELQGFYTTKLQPK